MQSADPDPYQAVRDEMAGLRHQVIGVRGCVIAGVDGLLILNEPTIGVEPHDVAALAAGAYGLSRTTGGVLGQGSFSEVTIRSQNGYLAVYAVGELALLAVIGDSGSNIARLHLEARPVTQRLADMLTIDASHPFG
ncbi:roadblock/LC7 domain-containing protein [Paractinoplanes durhamensis]|uniref:roadblock/LC7 domain-containing protein n=1 Tax=Paractinoplanes durhamensis TaxID=113563 RepID=UPI001EF21396|nr:roadblock/LC7 domain-containing protein [Actinoplanes durhamensis]